MNAEDFLKLKGVDISQFDEGLSPIAIAMGIAAGGEWVKTGERKWLLVDPSSAAVSSDVG